MGEAAHGDDGRGKQKSFVFLLLSKPLSLTKRPIYPVNTERYMREEGDKEIKSSKSVDTASGNDDGE